MIPELHVMNMNSDFTRLIKVFIGIWTHTAPISEPDTLLGVKNRRQSWKISGGSCSIILVPESKFGPTL